MSYDGAYDTERPYRPLEFGDADEALLGQTVMARSEAPLAFTEILPGKTYVVHGIRTDTKTKKALLSLEDLDGNSIEREADISWFVLQD